MQVTPEGKIKERFKRGLKDIPRVWPFMPVQTGYGATALDWLLCVNGWFVAVEAKKNNKTDLTPLQIVTSKLMREAGGLVLVIKDDASVDQALSAIRNLAHGPPSDWVKDRP